MNPPVPWEPTWMNQVVMSTLQDGSVRVIRRDDLLVLRFEFAYMTVQLGTDGYSYLQPRTVGSPGHLLVHFQTQSIAEPVAQWSHGGPQIPTQFPLSPVNAAGDTQLALEIPAANLPLRLTIENLLNWEAFTPLLADVALTGQEQGTVGPDPPPITDPTDDQTENDWTYIQAPPRLFLSPDSNATWQHQLGLQSNGIQHETELWHTVLTPIPGAPDGTRLRAIWSPDYTRPFAPKDDPLTYTLSADNRNQIVHLCSDYAALGSSVEAMQADLFALTSLGAWMELRGEWPTVGTGSGPQNYAVSAWHTRATMAREHYAMLVAEGHLYPFGHRAALITITERSEPSPYMYLTQTTYIVLRDRLRDLSAIGASGASRRQMPFQQVEVLTRKTPLLDTRKPGMEDQFWPMVGGNAFLFDLVGGPMARARSPRSSRRSTSWTTRSPFRRRS